MLWGDPFCCASAACLGEPAANMSSRLVSTSITVIFFADWLGLRVVTPCRLVRTACGYTALSARP